MAQLKKEAPSDVRSGLKSLSYIRRFSILEGHVYSWGINTHYEMLLLENTRS